MLLLLTIGAFGFANILWATTEIPSIIVTAKKPVFSTTPLLQSEFLGDSLVVNPKQTASYAQLMRSSTAVTARNAGGEGTTPFFLVRGQDSTQTRYFVDGVPLSDAQFNQSNIQWLPLRTLKSVDIYPEGIPVFLGEDGMGGAIQFHLTGNQSSNLGTRVGSYQYLNGFGSLSSEKGINVHLDYRESRENFLYYDDNGTPFDPSTRQLTERSHNSFRRFSLVPQISLFKNSDHEWRWFSLNGIGGNEIPGPTQLPNRGNLNQWFHLSAIKQKTRLSDSSEANGHLFVRYQKDDLQFETPTPLLGAGTSNNVAVGIKERFHLDKVDLMSGATWNQYTREFQTFFRVNQSRVDVPLGVSGKFVIAEKYLEVKPALLTQYFNYRSDIGQNRNFFLYSPRVGLLSEAFENLRLRSSVGRYYRAPTLFELYGSPTGISSNSNLNAEQGWSGEVGFDVELRGSLIKTTRFSYTFSVSRSENLIVLLPNSQQTRIAQNIGQSQISSHEFSVELRPITKSFFLKSGVTFVQAFNLTETPYEYAKRLPGRPEYRIQPAIGFETERWLIEYSVLFNGPQYWDSANQKRLSATSQHDMHVSYQTQGWGNLSLEGVNLLDSVSTPSDYDRFRTVDNTTGFMGYPAPGRRIYLSWSLNI